MNICASLIMKIMNVNKQIICGMFFLMKKILFNSFFICILLLSNPSFSNEGLVGKTLYCDSLEINGKNFKLHPSSFLDMAIEFGKDNLKVFEYHYIPGYVSVDFWKGGVNAWYTKVSLTKIEFYIDLLGKKLNYSLDRETLILKHEDLYLAQCNEYNLAEGVTLQYFFENITQYKIRKIEAEIKSKNKI